jgi:hypothetical protein
MDSGEVAVSDEAVKRALRVKARRIHRRALLVAAAVTLLLLLAPAS